MLTVIRTGPRNACLLAVIDEPGNRDALARQTADTQASGFSCKKDALKARVAGEPSTRAQTVAGFDGEPQQ